MKERKKLELGYSDFKNIIKNNNYFVDKSLLIEEVLKAQKKVFCYFLVRAVLAKQ